MPCFGQYFNTIWAASWQNQQNNCAPSEDSDQPSLIRVFAVHSMVAKDPSFLHADSEDGSDWADAHADLSLHWAHRSFCWFCHEAAYIMQHKPSWRLSNAFKLVFLKIYISIFIPNETSCGFWCCVTPRTLRRPCVSLFLDISADVPQWGPPKGNRTSSFSLIKKKKKKKKKSSTHRGSKFVSKISFSSCKKILHMKS